MEEPVMLAPFQSDPTSATAADPASFYHQVNLVSDIPGLAAELDSHLVNPWGVSFRTGSPFWISNQGSDSTTLYRVTAGHNGTDVGAPVPVFTVNIPPVAPGGPGPTGQVSNTNDSF